ncbi:hypothetical protein Sps_04276 [Shewanella psychrophila]|uniref:Uncharacterized protein n=1 Tax=Shewanella psychrophila TaxID=225848 RepID=A0A1S6HV64_9GAMM|nr:hypothetical protein Sps_04276 [Shewanella psychrophila]
MSYVCLEHTRPFTSDAATETTGADSYEIKNQRLAEVSTYNPAATGRLQSRYNLQQITQYIISQKLKQKMSASFI